MTTVVLKASIKGIVVIAFCAAGILKVTDNIAPEVHNELVRPPNFAQTNSLSVSSVNKKSLANHQQVLKYVC